MNQHIEKIKTNKPTKCNYNEQTNEINMIEIEGKQPIPIFYHISKDNPFNMTMIYCHESGVDLGNKIDELKELSNNKLKMRIASFDYPGYGLNKNNESDLSLEQHIDIVRNWIMKKGISRERIIIGGFAEAASLVLQYCIYDSKRMNEEKRKDISSFALLFPPEVPPIEFDMKLPDLVGEEQFVYYYGIWLIASKEKKFKKEKIKKLQSDANWSKRVEAVKIKMKITPALKWKKTHEENIQKSFSQWLRKFEGELNKKRMHRLVSPATAKSASIKVPSLPQHNNHYVISFLTWCGLNGFIEEVRKRRIYSILHLLTLDINDVDIKASISSEIFNRLELCIDCMKKYVVSDWNTIKQETLPSINERITPETMIEPKIENDVKPNENEKKEDDKKKNYKKVNRQLHKPKWASKCKEQQKENKVDFQKFIDSYKNILTVTEMD